MASTLPDRAVLEELATANRILFQQGVVDGFGHVSIRHPEHPDHFLLARSMAPAMVTADEARMTGTRPAMADKQRAIRPNISHGEGGASRAITP